MIKGKGISKAVKKVTADVTEGVVKTIINNNYCALLEINSQTDFVALSKDFKKLVEDILETTKKHLPTNLSKLLELKIDNNLTINDKCIDLTAKTGEKICVRRINAFNTVLPNFAYAYEHFNEKIAVILILSKKNDSVGKSLAMHIAALNPKFISTKNVSEDWVKNETEIIKKQTIAEGKPLDHVDMIVKGRINKSIAEVCLEEQLFLKDPTKKIKQILKENNVEIINFLRYEVGEGIEKKKNTNFSEEVTKQMKN